MQECPDLKESIEWDWVNDEFRYWLKNSDINDHKTEVLDIDANKVEALRKDFLDFKDLYNSNIKDLRNRAKNASYEIENLERRLSGKASMLENQFRHELANQTERIKPTLEDHFNDLSKKIATHSDLMLNAFTSKMCGIITGNDTKIAQSVANFQETVNQIVNTATDAAKSNLNSIASNMQQRFINQADEVTINFHQMVNEANANRFETPKPQSTMDYRSLSVSTASAKDNRDPAVSSIHPPTDNTPIVNLMHATTQPEAPANHTATRWKDVDPAYRQKLENFTPREPFQSHRSESRCDPATINELPPLQYDNIMKRVSSVQFTGHENLLVFYYQLFNSLSPYGCYLREVKDIKVDETICPDSWDGIPITTSRYKVMAACLYQKLASIDVIPLEFTSARNIVNQFAQDNDGYKVLYSLMAPLIQRDEIETWPQMSDCTTIHAYALKVTSYLNSEALKGRLYRQREQVSHFLLGLESDPQFRPAIARARNLMDTRNPTDPSVPSALKLAILPNTIERYMKEENCQAIVRVTNYKEDMEPATIRAINYNQRDHRSGDRDHDRSKYRNDTDRAGKSDKPCSICYHTGHSRNTCNGFAKFLIFRSAEQSTDTATRNKLIDSYKQHLKQRAEYRRKRQQLSTIRQMWASGKSFDEMEESLLASMPVYHSDDASTSSEE